MTRLLCVRIDADGTVTDGTCEVETAEVSSHDGHHHRTLVAARDFRDLDGRAPPAPARRLIRDPAQPRERRAEPMT